MPFTTADEDPVMTATLTPPAPASSPETTTRPTRSSPPPVRPLDYSTDVQPPVATGGREAYIDAFRGFVMLCLISRGFGFIELQKIENHPWLHRITLIFDHTDWAGITPWDMIQPWFMFIVGVAMPFAFAKRAAAGQSWGRQFGHAVKRAALLLLWAHIAMSVTSSPPRPVLELINVLSQIAFAYLIAFFVLGRRWTMQAGVAIGLLVAHTALHVLWHPPGVTGPWDKEANVGWYLDKVIIHKNWQGGYATINFITSAFNVIAGLMAGELLRGNRREPSDFVAGSSAENKKRLTLLISGIALICAGMLLSAWVPIIKRIWTSSFALLSTGICLLTLLLFYVVHRRWPNVKWGLFIVIGANPIFLYLANIMFGGHLRRLVNTYTSWVANQFFPSDISTPPPAALGYWVNFANAWGALLILIFVAYWLYRRKIFIRL